MALPLWILRGLQMQTKHKCGLAALFSLATISIILDIVRTVGTLSETSTNFYLGAIYNIVEIELAVIVSTLVAYRTLFSTQRKRSSNHRSITPHPQGRVYTRTSTSLYAKEERWLRLDTITDDSFQHCKNVPIGRSIEDDKIMMRTVA